jgi:tetratricopeptide (TPR) repeat protein
MDKELSLFNKVGDLYLKTGKVQAAVETYERAATIYEESGLHNNAIALCNKILRNAPGRTPVYLKLATLMVQRGFVAEAKQNLLEYASRMQQAGQLEDAFNALKEFADLSPENEEIRLLLAEQLKAAARTDEAKEQLAKLYHELEARGDERQSRATLEKIQALDPDFDLDTAPRPALKEQSKPSDLVFLDLSEPEAEAAAAVAEPEPAAPPAKELDVEPTSLAEEAPPEPPTAKPEPIELERGSADYLAVAEEAGDVEALAELDVPDVEVGEVKSVDGLDAGAEFEAPAEEEVAVIDIEPTAMDADVAAVEEVTEVEGLSEAAIEEVERVSEGFVPPDAIIEPPEERAAAPAVETAEPEAETAERVSEGFVPPDAIIEPPDEAAVETAPAPPPEAEPEYPEVSPPSTPVPAVQGRDSGSAEMDVPEIDVAAGLDEAGAAVAEAEPGDVARTPVPPDVGAAGVQVEEPPPAAVVPASVAELEDRVAEDPDDPALHRALGEALLEAGNRERGIEELDISLEIHESTEDWRHAEGLAEEILRLDPNSVRHHQKLVEFAFRRGDKARLADAYLGLADGLFRTGATERARAVYQRVLEHDPDSERALLGLQTLEPAVEAPPPEPAAPAAQPEAPAAAAPASGDFVDLGSLVLEEPTVRDTRMRIEEEEPTGDEQRDFEEMLSQFKRGIEANVADEDWQAHYDLGVAFKEMGLLDEAIAEFQKALRSEEGRLRAAEALGHCFFEKGQFSVAATVLRGAVDAGRGGDEGKIGLLYSLGRCEEEQGRNAEALTYYQRVFAIDIHFQDVGDRVKSLAQSGR